MAREFTAGVTARTLLTLSVLTMGLGLVLVRATAQVHGGDVTVVNRPGGGAEFILTLPDSVVIK